MSEVVGEAVVELRTDESNLNLDASGQQAGKGFGGGFLGGTKGLLLGGAVTAIGAQVVSSFTSALDLSAFTTGLQAELGLTEVQAGRAGEVAGDLYADNFGANAGEAQQAVSDLIGSVEGLANASEAELSRAGEAALGYSKVFKQDVSESVSAATAVINSGLAGDAVEAFDLLTAASQKVPAALRGDLQEAAIEYGKSFEQIGLSGEQAFSVLAQGAEQGTFGLDKAGDAVKEFTIRATDGSETSKEAFKQIGVGFEETSNALLAGGDKAAGATSKVVEGLLAIKDPTEQANAAIALFGTPLEDLGTKNIPQFLESLQGTGEALGNVTGATARANEILQQSPVERLRGLWRSFQGTLTDLASAALPPLLDGFDAVAGVLERVVPIVQNALGPTLSAIGTVITENVLPAFNGMGTSLGEQIVPTLQTFGVFLQEQVVPVLRRFGTYIIENIVPIVGQLATIFREQVIPTVGAVARVFIERILPVLVNVATTVAENLAPVFTTLVDVFRSRVLPTVSSLISQFRNQLLPAILPIIEKVISVTTFFIKLASAILGKVLPPIIRLVGFILSNVIPAIVSFITTVAKIVNGILDFGATLIDAGRKIGTFGATILGFVRDALGRMFDAIASLPGRILGLAGRFLNAGKSIIGSFVDGLKGAAGLVSDIAGNIVGAAKTLLNSAIGNVNRALEFTISLPFGKSLTINPPDIPFLASGTRNFPGGLAVVGEAGPELVRLPAGADVFSNRESRDLVGNSSSSNDDLAKSIARELAAILSGVAQRAPVQFVLPNGDPEAAALAAVDRLATV